MKLTARKSYLFSLLAGLAVLVGFCGSAWAIPGWGYDWTNANGTGIWNDPLNWDEGAVPTTADMAVLRHSDGVCRIESAAVCRATAGPGQGVDTFESHLDIIPGGSLAVTTTNWGEGLSIAYNGHGSVNMYGGSLDVQTVEAQVGGVSGSDGRILIQNGYFRVGGALRLNKNNLGGRARVHANGGTMDLGWLGFNGDAIMDITGGTVEIRADMVSNASQLPKFIAEGYITAYGGVGNVKYDYGVTKAGVTTITAEDTGVTATAGTVWDVSDSFSDDSSSKNVWSYGMAVASVVGDFWPLVRMYDPYNGQAGVKARYFHPDFPDAVVIYNDSGSVANSLQPGQIGMAANKAGLGWRETIIRWRAPADGTVQVQGEFHGGGGLPDAGHIIRLIRADGTGHVNIIVNWETYSSTTFDFPLNVHTGDIIEFVAANGSPAPETEIVPFDCTITALAGFGEVDGWDLVQDFSITDNPNDPWAYGHGMLSLLDGSQFIPFPTVVTDDSTLDPNDDVYIDGTAAWLDFWDHKVMYNLTNEAIADVSLWDFTTSRVALSGGWDVDSAIRWTSPGDGTVYVSGGFGPGYDDGWASAWVVKNGATVLASLDPIPVNVGTGLPFNLEVAVSQGDTIDFIAGAAGHQYHSTVPLHCTIYPKGSAFTEYNQAGRAHSPTVADGSDGVSQYPILGWTAGEGAVAHDIYFGTDYASVANGTRPVADLDGSGLVGMEDMALFAGDWLMSCATCFDFDGSGFVDLADFVELGVEWQDTADAGFAGQVAVPEFVPAGPLTLGQTYYYRVDEVSGLDIEPGEVWSFTVNPVAEANDVVLHNPDMGWVLQESLPVRGQGSSSMLLEPDYDYDVVDAVTVMLCWSDIETSTGVYDFSLADTAYDYWAGKGKEVTLRLSTESWLWWNQASPPSGLGVPQYVLDALPSGAKQVRNMRDHDYTVVDAREAYYLTRLEAFLSAVATHFDPSGARPVGIVDLGGFGVWGEWHSGYIYPSDAARRTALMGILDRYSAAFADHTLALSYSHDPDGPASYYSGPVTYYDPAHTTTYSDFLNYSAFDYALTKPNITFRRNGCGSALRSNERKFAYDTFAGLNKAPFTSEFAGGFIAFAKYLDGGRPFSPAGALNDALDLHPNYILCMGWDQHRAKLFIESRPDLVAAGLRKMGYRFIPSVVSLSTTVSSGQSINYNLSWINEAVGRAQRDYQLVFTIRNLDGSLVTQYNAGSVSTSTWIAGGGPYATTGSIPQSVAAGTYRVCVGMYDAATGRDIELPLINAFDGSYEIGIVQVQ